MNSRFHISKGQKETLASQIRIQNKIYTPRNQPIFFAQDRLPQFKGIKQYPKTFFLNEVKQYKGKKCNFQKLKAVKEDRGRRKYQIPQDNIEFSQIVQKKHHNKQNRNQSISPSAKKRNFGFNKNTQSGKINHTHLKTFNDSYESQRRSKKYFPNRNLQLESSQIIEPYFRSSSKSLMNSQKKQFPKQSYNLRYDTTYQIQTMNSPINKGKKQYKAYFNQTMSSPYSPFRNQFKIQKMALKSDKKIYKQ